MLFTTGIRFSVSETFCQLPEFTLIQKSLVSDSSYYYICRVTKDEFWAIGKKGIITQLGKKGIVGFESSSECSAFNNIQSYPNQGADLLNMTLLDESNYLLCGDRGIVYHFNKDLQSWSFLQVKGYENSCFYSICSIDKFTAFICGGRSKIVKSQRVIPFGFILKTEDGGKTWKQIFKSVTRMVWSIKYDKKNDEVLALLYTPVKSQLISSIDMGSTWKAKEKKQKGLFHDFNILDEKMIFAGGKNGNFKKNGAITDGNKLIVYENSGIFWDLETNNNIALASGTNGDLLYMSCPGNWNLIHTPVNNNLYEICFIDGKSAFLVGNNKLILKVDFK